MKLQENNYTRCDNDQHLHRSWINRVAKRKPPRAPDCYQSLTDHGPGGRVAAGPGATWATTENDVWREARLLSPAPNIRRGGGKFCGLVRGIGYRASGP
ncbi:unnamed protein product [Danaus chrysippus]|uniref:(African queen) hypothetical protein n=1 Tax=Danaus chrysippus TaxID=151541 RepID=A0A8J2QNT1_9NEOP|nr:unnamed protein product [Danaus chrysippus]